MAHFTSSPILIGLLMVVLTTACTTPPGADQVPTTVTVDSTRVQTLVTPPSINGPQNIPLDDGGRMEGMMKNNIRVGPWASYFKDNTLRSRITYVDGVEEGPTEVNHPNGMPYYTGHYLHGKNFGEWVFYNDRGDELKRVTYDSTGVIIQR